MFKEKIFVDNDRCYETTSHADHRLTYWEKEQIRSNCDNRMLIRASQWWRKLLHRENARLSYTGGRIEIPRKKLIR